MCHKTKHKQKEKIFANVKVGRREEGGGRRKEGGGRREKGGGGGRREALNSK